MSDIAVGDLIEDRARLSGVVVEIRGAKALIAWSNGVTTWCSLGYLRKKAAS